MIDSQTLIDAEKLVLSQAMDGSQAFADLRDKGISRQTFSLPAHQQIWTALETVAGTGGTVDALTVIARLEAQGQLDAVGGHAGVVETATYGALARYKTAAALEMVTEAAKNMRCSRLPPGWRKLPAISSKARKKPLMKPSAACPPCGTGAASARPKPSAEPWEPSLKTCNGA